MPVYTIDPLSDPRWPEFVARHPRSSIFHTSGWLAALRQAYGYVPIAYTTSPPGKELVNAFPFCRVETWLTSGRLVSLPFSDHCEPLVDGQEDLALLLTAAEKDSRSSSLSYVELRPLHSLPPGGSHFTEADSYVFHSLDLRPSLDQIYRNFHEDCVRRKIRRAERERLACEVGNSETLLRAFYRLFVQTRKRHGLPPQPFGWFRALLASLGQSVRIYVARRGDLAVAAILTLTHPGGMVYKYGCSDPAFNSLGGTQMLFWNVIQIAKAEHCPLLDLGRSDCDDSGLITFKERWGAARADLLYFRYSLRPSLQRGYYRQAKLARRLLTRFPPAFLSAAGRFLYRHMG